MTKKRSTVLPIDLREYYDKVFDLMIKEEMSTRTKIGMGPMVLKILQWWFEGKRRDDAIQKL